MKIILTALRYLAPFLFFLFLSSEGFASTDAPSPVPVSHDLHLHLGGCVSPEFVEKKLGRKLGDLSSLSIPQKFALVHKALSTPESITEAVLDVASHHRAEYLEIRSTPRAFDESGNLRPYVKAFSEGLERARAETGKTVYGLLSLDRYKHDLKIATIILKLAKEDPNIVGIDISGFRPGAKRTLSGSELARFVQMVLKTEGLGLGAHVGEFNDEVERKDNQVILKTIEEILQSKKKVWGTVRLGHGIYLTEEQKEIIRRLQIPVEVCPSCHKQVTTCQNSGPWYVEGEAHPTHDTHKGSKVPVVFGVDDSFVFSVKDFEEEFAEFEALFPNRMPWQMFVFPPQ